MTGQNLVSISQIVLWYENSFRIDWSYYRSCTVQWSYYQAQT